MPSRRRQETREALVEEVRRRDKIARLHQQMEWLTRQVAALVPQQHTSGGRGRRGQVSIEEVQHRDRNVQDVTIEDIEEATEDEEFDYEVSSVFDNEDTEEATREEEFDYDGPPVFDSERVEEAMEDGEFDYDVPSIFDSEGVEEAVEDEEFVVGDVGQALVVRQSFLTHLENNTDWFRNDIFQSMCIVRKKKNVLRSVKTVGNVANLLTIVKFETNMGGYEVVYVFVKKLADSEQEVTRRVQQLLEEFYDDFPEEPSDGLPPELPSRGDNSNTDDISSPSNSRANFSQPKENDEGKIIIS